MIYYVQMIIMILIIIRKAQNNIGFHHHINKVIKNKNLIIKVTYMILMVIVLGPWEMILMKYVSMTKLNDKILYIKI